MEGADLEESTEIDADVAAHTAIVDAHHAKTTSFAELIDAATDAQIPDNITVDYAASAASATTATSASTAAAVPWSGITGTPSGFADGVDNDTLYSSGTGLSLAGTMFSLDATYADGRYVNQAGDVMAGALTTPNLTVPGIITAGSIQDPTGILNVGAATDIEFSIDDGGSAFSFFEVFNGVGSHVFWVNENGDARVYGNLTADGDLQADRLVYSSPRTHYFTVGGEAFVPGSDVAYFNSYGNGGAYISSGGGALVAPVHLPHGAEVTELKVFFNDNSVSDMTVNLQRLRMAIGGYNNLATVGSSGISGYGNRTDTTISSATIDNTLYGYTLYAFSGAWDGSNMKIMGAVVTYTMSEAL